MSRSTLPASELEALVSRVLHRHPSATREQVLQEVEYYDDDEVDCVVRGFETRREAELEKEEGNKHFKARRYDAALTAYRNGLAELMDSPLDMRLRAVLHSNLSACLLAKGKAKKALKEAEAATEADPTFDKGWLRLGMAIEAKACKCGGCGGRALDAYQKISSTNAEAAARVAAIGITVTTDGITNVRDESLNVFDFSICHEPTAFLNLTRLFHPSEPLLPGEARVTSHEYGLRLLMVDLAKTVEEYDPDDKPDRTRHVLWQGEGPGEQLWFDLIGLFGSLQSIIDDGCSRQLFDSSPTIPVAPVRLWVGRGKPGNDLRVHLWAKKRTESTSSASRRCSSVTRAFFRRKTSGSTRSRAFS
jgi:hypothetical protein